MALCIDVSAYQPAVDFQAVKKSGVAGVWMKLTEGATYVDGPAHLSDKDRVAWLTNRVRNARTAGLRVGFYHFAHPETNTPTVEAAHFAKTIKAVGGIGRRDLRPVLDLEAGRPNSRYATWARTFNHNLVEWVDVGPLFYSYVDYIDHLYLTAPIGYGLWLAGYGANDGHRHPTTAPAPWKRYAAHQFTSNGRVPGVAGKCDLSYVPALRRVLAHPVKGLV